jgi:hypothetical protein
MIPVNELRINNYILYLDEVYMVHGLKYEENAPSEKWRVAFKTIDGKLENAKMANWINPIPLTPELLEKCGFEKHEPDSIFRSVSYTIWEDVACFRIIKRDGDYFSIPGYPATRIYHLHQLQNLYFAIMNQGELSIIL